MKRHAEFLTLCMIFLIIGLLVFPSFSTADAQGETQKQSISQEAAQQIKSLLEEKASRTGAQKKISSQLLYAIKTKRGQVFAKGIQSLRTTVQTDTKGRVIVDIKAQVTRGLIKEIKESGGEIVYSSEQYNAIRAVISLDALESLASREDVISIRQAAKAMTLQNVNETDARRIERRNTIPDSRKKSQ